MKFVELEKNHKRKILGAKRGQNSASAVSDFTVWKNECGTHMATSWPLDIQLGPGSALKASSFTGAENVSLDQNLHEPVRVLTVKKAKCQAVNELYFQKQSKKL